MANREDLGNSLQSLLGEAIGIIASDETITKLNPAEIQPNEAQPRKHFTQDQMKALVQSIQEHGILQPIIISPTNEGYKIIAGERRWRAAKLLGLSEIPVLVKSVDSMKALELALVENIQELVSRGTISMGHARALLSLKSPKERKILSDQIVADGLSVREVEMIVSGEKRIASFSSKKHADTKTASSRLYKSPQICALEDKLREFIGAKVLIKERNGKGKITIEFSDNSQFEDITEKLEALMKTPA
jgi:ParB family chromosome partitioning protein